MVTRNRPVLLAEVLRGLRSQTREPDQVFVVDNASGPQTREVLSASGVKVIRSEVNVGGAGGFALGMASALAGDFDWIWLMDDDAVPEEPALHELENALCRLPAHAAVVCCQVREFGSVATTHRRRFDDVLGFERPCSLHEYQAPMVAVDTASFVGFMVRADVARIAGVPRGEFFLSYDDTEYSLRLRQCGFSLWLVPTSVITHKRQSSNRLRSTRFGMHHYFNVRNRIMVKRSYCHAGWIAGLGGAMFGLALCLFSPGRFEWRAWRVLAAAIQDGFAGRLGPFPKHLHGTHTR